MRNDQRLLLGLDEAGRGSVFGPLVVGGFAIRGSPEGTQAILRGVGARDSKTLSPTRRGEVYRRLKPLGTPATASAEPARIDTYVEQGKLNTLEVELMASIVVRLQPDLVLADACDPDARRFARQLAARAEGSGWKGKVMAAHHADRDLPLVGAASVIAKVTRDRALARIARRAGTNLGSGYPSDPTTRDHLKGLLGRSPLPRYVRSSWATVRDLREELAHPPLESFGT